MSPDIQHARADDVAWFAAHPDREYRCRRCHPCEYIDIPPSGFAVFAVVHRFYIDYPEVTTFGAPLMFDPQREDDAGCRVILRNLAIDPRAYFNSKK
jgi:hypothetical protein